MLFRSDLRTGRPVINPAAYYDLEPVLMTPAPPGAHNWNPMSFSPLTGLVYFPVQEVWLPYSRDPGFAPTEGKQFRSNTGWGGTLGEAGRVATELGNIRAQKASTQADIAVLERQLDAGSRRITPAIIARFGDLLRRKLHEPDGRTRKEYIHLLVDRVEVGDREVRITGRNAMLERAIMASQTPGAAVPKAERKWRARRDSNPRPRR